MKCKQFWQKERNNIVFQNIDSILHCFDTQNAQPHYTNADVAFARECYCVTNSYLQTLV